MVYFSLVILKVFLKILVFLVRCIKLILTFKCVIIPIVAAGFFFFFKAKPFLNCSTTEIMKKCWLYNLACCFNISSATKVPIFPFCVHTCWHGFGALLRACKLLAAPQSPAEGHQHCNAPAEQLDNYSLLPVSGGSIENHLYFHYNWPYLLWETLQRLLSKWQKALDFKQLEQL